MFRAEPKDEQLNANWMAIYEEAFKSTNMNEKFETLVIIFILWLNFV